MAEGARFFGCAADAGRRFRRRTLCVLFACVPGCAGARQESSEIAPGLAPRPPGIAVDPALELPEPSASAPVDDGLVVLGEPTDTRPARRTVDDFLSAVVREDSDALEPLLDKSARTHIGSRGRSDALSTWRRRFEHADYTALSQEIVYRPSEVEVHTASDARTLGNERNFPVAPRGDQVLVRVPVAPGDPARLLGSEIVFLLKPAPGGYKIEEIFEESRLP